MSAEKSNGGAPSPPVRPVAALLVYLFVVFIGGALLAPWLYRLAQAFGPSISLADRPFHRYVDRCLMVLALLGMYPLLRGFGVRSWRDVGLVSPAGQWSRLAGGFALGFGSLVCVVALTLAAHGRLLNTDLTAAKLASKLAAAAGSAILVALLEETLFRGGIFNALRRVWDWRLALLVSSMLYALVHFMEKAEQTGPVFWDSGLKLLLRMLHGFGDLSALVPGFLSLTLAGIILALPFQKTGNLWFSFGLHAGWIFWLKSYNALTVTVADSQVWLWGTGKMTDGWLAAAVLALTLVIMLRLPLSSAKESP